MLQDYVDFIEWGQALWQGRYIGWYPLPMTIFFAGLSLIPVWVGYALLVVVSVVILLRRFKWQAPLWFAYIPILQVLLVGNIDVLWMGLYYAKTPLSLTIMSLKPQLFWYALPDVWQMRHRWKEFLGWGVLVYGPAFLLRPFWVLEWLQLLRGYQQTVPILGDSAAIWSMPQVVAVVFVGLCLLVAWKVKGLNWRPATLFINPSHAYDYALIAGSTYLIIPLSWICQYLEVTYHLFWPWALLGALAILLSKAGTREVYWGWLKKWLRLTPPEAASPPS
jgi:hypothetical protein